jgi:hypothetical protein
MTKALPFSLQGIKNIFMALNTSTNAAKNGLDTSLFNTVLLFSKTININH